MSKEIIVLIGVAGSGKSTIRQKLLEQHPDYKVYSHDDLRAEFYVKRTGRTPDARDAFRYCSENDREYGQYAKTFLANLVRSGVGIIADSTNLTPARRMKYVNAKYQYGYELRAIVVNTPLDECIARQVGRGDKAVPEDSVREQHSKINVSDLRRYYADVQWVPDDIGFEKVRSVVAGPEFNVYDPAQLKAWVDTNRMLVSVRQVKNYPGLRILKYTHDCMYRNLWDYAAIEMRGLVVDENWNIVVHPFTKLAAEGEALGILPVVRFRDDQCVTYARKVNGFMAAYTDHPKYGPLFSTTGSMDSRFVDMAKEHLEGIQAKSEGLCTWLFEICDPTDPHIVVEASGATPIALRPHRQNAELLGTSKALVGDLRQELKRCRHEGFVVQDPETGRLIKMKSRYYALIKRIGRTEPQNVNRIICDTAALSNAYGEDLMPLYQMMAKGTPLNAALTSLTDSEQRVWVLRQSVDQVYSQLGYNDG